MKSFERLSKELDKTIKARYNQMTEFDESKHPRAEDGRFTDGQNDVRNKSIKQLEEEQAREVNRPKDIVVSANLTNQKNKVIKQEWARYYSVLGEIKAGTFTPMRTKQGGNVIRIDNKFFFDNGNFEKPKVNKVYSFSSEEAISDFISYSIVIGVLKQ